ncbi:MAG: glycosyltransferase [Ferruginibacter sp.]
MKHILFISYDGMTDPLGQSQVIPYLAGLTHYGYRFTILSCDKPEKYAANHAYVKALMAPYAIEWISVPYHKNPPVLSSVYDYYQLRKAAAALYKKDPYQLVHTRVGLPTLVAVWLKKKFNVKFLNDIRGFWADERVDGGMWKLSNPLYKMIYNFFKKHEVDCLIKADYNTCLTYAAKKEIHSWKNIPNQPVKIEVIPCSADLELFDPQHIDATLKQQFATNLNITEADTIISYLGSIGGWYLTADMMRCCKAISNQVPTAKFLFIAQHEHEAIRAAAIAAGIDESKLIIQSAKRHEVPVLLSFSSYSIFFIKPCYSKMSSSPTKHGEIMAMGIPVITNSGVGDVKEIVEKYNAGIVIDAFNDTAFNAVAQKIASGITFNNAEIRKGAIDFYALNNAIEKYKKVYTALFNNA